MKYLMTLFTIVLPVWWISISVYYLSSGAKWYYWMFILANVVTLVCRGVYWNLANKGKIKSAFEILRSDRYVVLTRQDDKFYSRVTINPKDIKDYETVWQADQAVRQVREIVNLKSTNP